MPTSWEYEEKSAKSYNFELSLDKNIITKQGKYGDYDYTVPFEIVPDDSDIVILAACSLHDGKATLAAPVYDEIQNNRPFTFKMSKKEKAEYILGKCVWNLNDRDEFIKANNRGKEK